MYNLPYFKAKDQQQVLDFMHQNPFIILTGCNADQKPVATHVPVLIKEREGNLFLQGHIMRNTDHEKAFETNPNVLALFNGPHTYVSASWYTNPQEGSTWNYLTVHAKGLLSFQPEEFLRQLLGELTAHFENNEASPALYEHLPEEYVNKLSKAIVGFEIAVTDIDNVFKLSQNRDEKSYEQIISQLSKGDDEAQKISQLMNQNK